MSMTAELRTQLLKLEKIARIAGMDSAANWLSDKASQSTAYNPSDVEFLLPTTELEGCGLGRRREKSPYDTREEEREIRRQKLIEKREDNHDLPINALRSAAYGFAYKAVKLTNIYNRIATMDCKPGLIIENPSISDIKDLYSQHETQCARANTKPILPELLLEAAPELVRAGVLMAGRRGYYPSFGVIEESANRIKIPISALEKNEDAGFVYVINNEDNSTFKIGCTTDLGKRKSSLQTSASSQLKYVTYFKSGKYKKAEKILHRHFGEKRLSGEWFALGSTDISNIRNPSFLKSLGIVLVED